MYTVDRKQTSILICKDKAFLGSETVKNLGMWFNSGFPCLNMFKVYAKNCFMQLRDIRQFLTDDASILMANALVSSQLDYCNLLFKSLRSIYVNHTLSQIV